MESILKDQIIVKDFLQNITKTRSDIKNDILKSNLTHKFLWNIYAGLGGIYDDVKSSNKITSDNIEEYENLAKLYRAYMTFAND